MCITTSVNSYAQYIRFIIIMHYAAIYVCGSVWMENEDEYIINKNTILLQSIFIIMIIMKSSSPSTWYDAPALISYQADTIRMMKT